MQSSAPARTGQVAIVGGAGPIGLLTAAVLKAEGLTVFISELSEARKKMALSTGVADEVLDPREGDVAETVRQRTNGQGADVGFECSSVPVVLDMLLDAVRPGAVIVNVSIWGHKPEVDMPKLVLKEIESERDDLVFGRTGSSSPSNSSAAGESTSPPSSHAGHVGSMSWLRAGSKQLINNDEQLV